MHATCGTFRAELLILASVSIFPSLSPFIFNTTIIGHPAFVGIYVRFSSAVAEQTDLGSAKVQKQTGAVYSDCHDNRPLYTQLWQGQWRKPLCLQTSLSCKAGPTVGREPDETVLTECVLKSRLNVFV